jgi:hypothetical protein
MGERQLDFASCSPAATIFNYIYRFLLKAQTFSLGAILYSTVLP